MEIKLGFENSIKKNNITIVEKLFITKNRNDSQTHL